MSTTRKSHRPVRAARSSIRHRRALALTAVAGFSAAALSLVAVAGPAQAVTAAGPSTSAPTPGAARTGLPPIKHVWFIILENKSYDATFTGLNNNTYLWKTLPSQGTLLTNYFGTGHFSLDNYEALASGQAPSVDNQSDCPIYKDLQGGVDTNPSDPNYGQMVAAGPLYQSGTGCVYPASVPTLFNQLDSAGVSWKGYAQDLGNPDSSGPPHAVTACGAPGSDPTNNPVPNPGSANATDQYVPKHFPFPWFHSVIDNPNDCNSTHIANLFSVDNGLYHDLQKASTTPAFSWISPNNCSDAHDAVCHGNNLSGGWLDPNTPNAPVNYTGGLYASDLFLEHVIPEIEASPAFKQGGLIDISFDEGFPAFTFTGNSFANSPTDPPNVASSIASDTAGENVNGANLYYEPTGPNTPLTTNAAGQQLYPGPGNNAFIDRDPTIPGLILGGGGTPPPARLDAVSGSASSPRIFDPAVSVIDQGRTVTGVNIPAGAVVGKVLNLPATATLPNGAGCSNACAVNSSFYLRVNGVRMNPTGPVTSVTLGARTDTTDPLYSAFGAATGGGDVGSVLISKYIKPGSTDGVFYNHYSWLRTMEDLFGVGATSPGLDGAGHIGFAAQRGLRSFGTDVFNNW